MKYKLANGSSIDLRKVIGMSKLLSNWVCKFGCHSYHSHFYVEVFVEGKEQPIQLDLSEYSDVKPRDDWETVQNKNKNLEKEGEKEYKKLWEAWEKV